MLQQRARQRVRDSKTLRPGTGAYVSLLLCLSIQSNAILCHLFIESAPCAPVHHLGCVEDGNERGAFTRRIFWALNNRLPASEPPSLLRCLLKPQASLDIFFSRVFQWRSNYQCGYEKRRTRHVTEGKRTVPLTVATERPDGIVAQSVNTWSALFLTPEEQQAVKNQQDHRAH
jgi:hypothetical protein